ncbi:MAG: RagB/SusD family nutrient uptake outer membrane protein [Tannerellaceae bacterium]|jgi:hypothetical protein|nr:RagB/SusD family nutrient uptake outer membrane protein [Tannerellaceae bacterium]
MRKNIYVKSVLAALLMTVVSCEPEMDFINPSTENINSYYNTKEHLTYAVNGAYNIMQRMGAWARCMPMILDIRSDEYVYSPDAAGIEIFVVQISSHTIPADCEATTQAFGSIYVLQYAANLALEKLQENQDGAFDLDKPDDKALYDRLMGEAYFLRGLSRFYLTFIWGDEIPDRDYTSTGGDDFYMSPSEPGVIYGRIVGDFKKAEELLPVRSVVYANPADIGRATKGAAQAFLAKTYMARPLLDGTAGPGSAEWELAKAELKKIIDSGEYELVNNYRDNTSEDNENNKESLFEVQFCRSYDATGDSPWSDMQFGSFRTGQNTWRQIEMTTPRTTGRWCYAIPSLALYNEFERDNQGKIIDPRAYQGLWIPDGPKFNFLNSGWGDYTIMFDNPTWQGKWFGTRKFGTDEQAPIDARFSGINERMIRYADILLMYAECCIETGDNATALQYINKVRTRANNQMINPTEADAHMFYATGQGRLPAGEDLIAAAPVLGQVKEDNGNVIIPGFQINTVRRLLKHEYSAELYLEGWRFFNLLRWYNNPNDPDASVILTNLAEKYKMQDEQIGTTVGVSFDYTRHRLAPIPANELQTNPAIKGNPAN